MPENHSKPLDKLIEQDVSEDLITEDEMEEEDHDFDDFQLISANNAGAPNPSLDLALQFHANGNYSGGGSHHHHQWQLDNVAFYIGDPIEAIGHHYNTAHNSAENMLRMTVGGQIQRHGRVNVPSENTENHDYEQYFSTSPRWRAEFRGGNINLVPVEQASAINSSVTDTSSATYVEEITSEDDAESFVFDIGLMTVGRHSSLRAVASDNMQSRWDGFVSTAPTTLWANYDLQFLDTTAQFGNVLYIGSDNEVELQEEDGAESENSMKEITVVLNDLTISLERNKDVGGDLIANFSVKDNGSGHYGGLWLSNESSVQEFYDIIDTQDFTRIVDFLSNGKGISALKCAKIIAIAVGLDTQNIDDELSRWLANSGLQTFTVAPGLSTTPIVHHHHHHGLNFRFRGLHSGIRYENRHHIEVRRPTFASLIAGIETNDTMTGHASESTVPTQITEIIPQLGTSTSTSSSSHFSPPGSSTLFANANGEEESSEETCTDNPTPLR